MIKIVKNPIITSDFGLKRNFGDSLGEHIHNGIDFISATDDREVFAMVSGTVCYDFDDYKHGKRYEGINSGGNMVIIQSEKNGKVFYTRYLHLVENYVEPGQKIKAGEKIGVYGDVGYSKGPHVHAEVCDSKWKKVDPRKYIDIY
jgi:murein DD-endopeptidase MepM/ murein hydrolase activator NlpD